MQDCSNSIANTLELLQSCTKPSVLTFWCETLIRLEKGFNSMTADVWVLASPQPQQLGIEFVWNKKKDYNYH